MTLVRNVVDSFGSAARFVMQTLRGGPVPIPVVVRSDAPRGARRV
jgi:hypothetical protein